MYNRRTKVLIDIFNSHPSDALLIHGESQQSNELSLYDIAKHALGSNYPSYLHEFSPNEKNIIGIDVAREAKAVASKKVHSQASFGRIIAFLSAEALTIEAQNALLKLAEEPNDATLIVFVTTSRDALLPTVRSRCTEIPILPLSKEQAFAIAEERDTSQSTVNRAYHVSGGYFSEFIAALQSTELPDSLIAAKEFLGMSTFDRIVAAKKFDNKKTISHLISGLLHISRSALHADSGNSERWQDIASEASNIQQKVKENLSPKLAYLRLSVMLY